MATCVKFRLARRHLGQHFRELLLENNSCCSWCPKLLAPTNQALQTLRSAVTFGNKNNKCCFQQQSPEHVDCLSCGVGRAFSNLFPITLKILHYKISELKLTKTLRPERFWPKSEGSMIFSHGFWSRTFAYFWFRFCDDKSPIGGKKGKNSPNN